MKCFTCKEKLVPGDRPVVGNNGFDLMCIECFDEMKLQEDEYRERMKHDSSYMYHEAHNDDYVGNSEQRAYQAQQDAGWEY
tara:strand:- start:155 stop:397 length:243 start_codon:yes stop_codon:yes gene_type:complete